MQDLFPNLFRITLTPNITVHEFLLAADRQHNFYDPLNSAARSEFNRLQTLLRPIRLSSDADVLHWRWTANGIFSISRAHNFFIYSGMISRFPKSIWFLHIPAKVKIFMWLTFHNKILTAANLRKHKFPMPDHYPLCCSMDESVDYLFLAGLDCDQPASFSTSPTT